MADLIAAHTYINANVISNEDWLESDEAKQQRLLNVAERTLLDEYESLTITDDAVYEFAAFLAIVFNDTNKMQQQGVAGFSVTGVGSFTFKENNVTNATGQPLEELIPNSVKRIIEKSNDVTLTGKKVGWLI